ncbi:hypothetical protein [Robertmurraya siralis]|uniref:hypothetical protein n=1 Tax=Robertmurraya siralis TaxID=77777 RepID=UPI0010F62607|nr:hypothetical protein [Robertmurraya siralis]
MGIQQKAKIRLNVYWTYYGVRKTPLFMIGKVIRNHVAEEIFQNGKIAPIGFAPVSCNYEKLERPK